MGGAKILGSGENFWLGENLRLGRKFWVRAKIFGWGENFGLGPKWGENLHLHFAFAF